MQNRFNRYAQKQKITGQETYSSAGWITSKNEIIIMGKEKALLRWI